MSIFRFLLYLLSVDLYMICIIFLITINIIILIIAKVGDHFSDLPFFLNINIFLDFESSAVLLTFFRRFRLPPNCSNVQFFFNIKVFPDFELSAGLSTFFKRFRLPPNVSNVTFSGIF